MTTRKQSNSAQNPDNSVSNSSCPGLDGRFQIRTVLSSNGTKQPCQAAKNSLARSMLNETHSMKVAAKENRKALDYFSSTIIPSQALQTIAVLTIKHAVLLIGFGVGVMALVRLILAD